MSTWSRRPPLRVLTAVGSGFRIGVAHLLRLWPLLLGVELAVRLPAGLLLLRWATTSRHASDPLRTAIQLLAEILPPLLGATLIAGAVGRARRHQTLALRASVRAGLAAAATPVTVTLVTALLAWLVVVLPEEFDVLGGLLSTIVSIAFALFVTRTVVAGPAAACERLGPGAALMRSLQLLRGVGWPLFRMLLLLGVAWLALRQFSRWFVEEEVAWWLAPRDGPEGEPPFAHVALLDAIVAALDALFWLGPAAIAGALYDQAREREGQTIAELKRTFA